MALTEGLRDALGHLNVIDFGEATLSEEDRQFLRTRIWCDHLVASGARCARRADRLGACTAGQPAG